MLRERDEVDYLLFVDGKAIGNADAQPEGYTLTGVEEQSGKYGKGLLDIYPKWREPLPFAYESTGVETQFTNRFDPFTEEPKRFRLSQTRDLQEYLEPEHQLNTRFTDLSERRSDARHESLFGAEYWQSLFFATDFATEYFRPKGHVCVASARFFHR